LKLKDTVDANDAAETMQFYNVILQQLDMIVASPANPRDTAYNECLNVLIESAYPLVDEEMFKIACVRNPQVGRYIGKVFKLEHNKKLRPILEMLQQHSRIKIVQMKPIVLQYMRSEMVKTSDSSDLTDLLGDTIVQNLEAENTPENCTEMSNPRSDRSDSSDSIPNYVPGNGNGHLLRCYYCEAKGSIFETNSESEYFRHGNQKHLNKPMYPNLASITKNGLKPQGRNWEV
jgi:hypothetical protein